jgi:hypothetical protein
MWRLLRRERERYKAAAKKKEKKRPPMLSLLANLTYVKALGKTSREGDR